MRNSILCDLYNVFSCCMDSNELDDAFICALMEVLRMEEGGRKGWKDR